MSFKTKKMLGIIILGAVGIIFYDSGHQPLGIFFICGASNLLFMEERR